MLALVLVSRAGSAAVCGQHPQAVASLVRLRVAMAEGRFVSYQPTAITMTDGRPTRARPESIRADLTVLRPRFDSLLTYGALNGAEAIPEVASSLGFRALVIGVWNPFNPKEVDAALTAAREYPSLVVGLVVGNEWLFARRPHGEVLGARLAEIRARAPALPIATTEPFHVFYPEAAVPLLRELDFLAPNVHAVFQPWFRDAPSANAAAFVAGVVDELAARFCGPILVKETGVPTAPADAGFSAARQSDFYRALERRLPRGRERAFSYFAAFDAPWRVADEQAAPGIHPEEAHWGLYDAARAAKPVVAGIPLLSGRD